MEQTIKICMSVEDADMVQKIFDTDANADFTIVNKFVFPSGDTIQLELMASSTMDIWFLAKRVYMYQDHEERMQRLIQSFKPTENK